ncbi:hypothetical protein P168DRAFT_286964 [Aspergillus campestris IBT 28561]|uniref:Uncharacterized protein n=1 Tax=Aspergillus campestris (strain IBT 28561) TaxID=1392248 RepID=A0A2I1DG90_ASPC2|nr:uncharacterized protein P168DRAFT_286964 [Aspergillus campestris IBT 28561]PKY08890.1 hypothetical protein P168DRAFT_286964 [Aspergillus campestris IBT 28561]
MTPMGRPLLADEVLPGSSRRKVVGTRKTKKKKLIEIKDKAKETPKSRRTLVLISNDRVLHVNQAVCAAHVVEGQQSPSARQLAVCKIPNSNREIPRWIDWTGSWRKAARDGWVIGDEDGGCNAGLPDNTVTQEVQRGRAQRSNRRLDRVREKRAECRNGLVRVSMSNKLPSLSCTVTWKMY